MFNDTPAQNEKVLLGVRQMIRHRVHQFSALFSDFLVMKADLNYGLCELCERGRKDMFYLTTHSTHFICERDAAPWKERSGRSFMG